MENLSPEVCQKYISFQKEAKSLAAEGCLEDSLNLFKKAYAILPTEKIKSRMKKLEDLLAQDSSGDEEEETANAEIKGMVEVTQGFRIHETINKKLYPYQKEGVAWLFGLYKKEKGGILGDDMGLGKTFQVIAFLSGMIDAQFLHSVLIIMPVSLLPNWSKEFEKWCPGITVHEFYGSSKRAREMELDRTQRRGGVLLTSYGMVVSNHQLFSKHQGRPFIWDYVVLDEGHKIKNPTKTTKAVHEIAAKNRIVITGTAIQNNLMELWALYDFAHHGTLLGSQKTFKQQYEIPILRSREKCCSTSEQKLGDMISANLMNLINPYFLRRTKEEVLQNKIEDVGEEFDKMRLTQLPKKNDFIVWVYINPVQHNLYKEFLNSDTVKSILVDKRSPLVELTILKKICDHPRLFSHHACQELGLNSNMDDNQLSEVLDNKSPTINNVSDEKLMSESGKLAVAIDLLDNLRTTGHRTLVFSQSRKILDMIQRILINRKWKVLRVDGTILKMTERARRITLFQTDKSWSVFLLTTQVGGVGITLTGADRVIIYDPSWNPATDSQAVDRVYRIGQTKEVIVYRLMTCATVEERIYRRQIFKDSIMRQTTGNQKNPHRYFSRLELRELFQLDDIRRSKTQMQLAAMHSHERKTSTELDEHIAFLHSLDIFGISDHDLMFSKNAKIAPEDMEIQEESQEDYLKHRVNLAQKKVQEEAAFVADGLQLSNNFVKPFTLAIPTKSNKKTPDSYKPPEFPDIIELKNINPSAEDFPHLTHKPRLSPYSKYDSPDFDRKSVKNESFKDSHKRVQQAKSPLNFPKSSFNNSADKNQNISLVILDESSESGDHSFSKENVSSVDDKDTKIKLGDLCSNPSDYIVESKVERTSFGGSGDHLDRNENLAECKEALKDYIKNKEISPFSEEEKYEEVQPADEPVVEDIKPSVNEYLDSPEFKYESAFSSPHPSVPINVGNSVPKTNKSFTNSSEHKKEPESHSENSVPKNGSFTNRSEYKKEPESDSEEMHQNTSANLGIPHRRSHCDFLGLSDDESIVTSSRRKSKRKSCVIRRSTILLSDSDSCASNNASGDEILACDSEEDLFQQNDSRDKFIMSVSKGSKPFEDDQKFVTPKKTLVDSPNGTPVNLVKNIDETPKKETLIFGAFSTLSKTSEAVTPQNKITHCLDETPDYQTPVRLGVRQPLETPKFATPVSETAKTTAVVTPSTCIKISTPTKPSVQFQSPRRITPLRVSHIKLTPQKILFDKAMNESIEFPLEVNPNSTSDDLEDSIIAVRTPKASRRILSDSDDSPSNTPLKSQNASLMKKSFSSNASLDEQSFNQSEEASEFNSSVQEEEDESDFVDSFTDDSVDSSRRNESTENGDSSYVVDNQKNKSDTSWEESDLSIAEF